MDNEILDNHKNIFLSVSRHHNRSYYYVRNCVGETRTIELCTESEQEARDKFNELLKEVD